MNTPAFYPFYDDHGIVEYCTGFMFDKKDPNYVMLVIKNRPQWQAGYRNGIGGKLEPGETPSQAMVREFMEETGIVTTESDWQRFTSHMYLGGHYVHFFSAFVERQEAQQMTDEYVGWHDIRDRHFKENCLRNLEWLIPQALMMNRQFESGYDVYREVFPVIQK